MFLQLLANGLVTGSVIAIAAVGVSVVYGILRIVNFAYGDVMAFGAFTAFLCNVTWHLPLVLSVVLAMAATALAMLALPKGTYCSPTTSAPNFLSWSLITSLAMRGNT